MLKLTSAPSTRAHAALSTGGAPLPHVLRLDGQDRTPAAGLCAEGARGLPQVWPAGTRLMPQLRFLFASKPDVMSKALGIVYRTIATHLIHTAGHTHDTAHAGAITFIQRFGSALNLNVHLMCRDARMSRAHGCAGATMARLASSTSSMLGPGVRQIRKVEAPKPTQTCMFIARSNENSPQSGLCKSEGRSRPPHFGVATRACPLGRPLRRPQKRASSLTT